MRILAPNFAVATTAGTLGFIPNPGPVGTTSTRLSVSTPLCFQRRAS